MEIVIWEWIVIEFKQICHKDQKDTVFLFQSFSQNMKLSIDLMTFSYNFYCYLFLSLSLFFDSFNVTTSFHLWKKQAKWVKRRRRRKIKRITVVTSNPSHLFNYCAHREHNIHVTKSRDERNVPFILRSVT